MVWNEAAKLLHKAHHLEKPPFIFTAVLASFIGLAIFVYLIINRGTRALQGILPGTFGWPFIGETLEFIGCQRRGSPQDFFHCRTKKYGNIFPTSLVGHPTVVLCSPEGNRFFFSNENKLVVNSWPTSVGNLFRSSLITTIGDDAKRLRKILMTFLRPEALQKFVGRVDSMTKSHLAEYWIGKDEVGKATREQDLLSFLISNVDEQGESLTDNEIEDNILLLLYAGHDTSSYTLTVLLKFLAENPQCYEEVLREQLDIAGSKEAGKLLEWEDLQRMKYSWRVAHETLRVCPAVQGSFHKAIKDFKYEGFTILKDGRCIGPSIQPTRNSSISGTLINSIHRDLRERGLLPTCLSRLEVAPECALVMSLHEWKYLFFYIIL